MPPVGESKMYQLDDSPSTLTYNAFPNVVVLHESHLRGGQEDQDQVFQQIMSRWEA